MKITSSKTYRSSSSKRTEFFIEGISFITVTQHTSIDSDVWGEPRMYINAIRISDINLVPDCKFAIDMAVDLFNAMNQDTGKEVEA